MDGRQVIVWSETAYKTGKCFKCGRRVRRRNSIEPCGTTMMSTTVLGKWAWLACPRCKCIVGKISKAKMTEAEIQKFIEEEKPLGGNFTKGDYMI